MSLRNWLRLFWLELKYELLYPWLADPCVVIYSMVRDSRRHRKTANQ